MTCRVMWGLSLLPVLAGCERNQEQMTPAAKTESGREKAQDYPSARNTENPDPSIGGTNSAATQKGSPDGAVNPTGTGGSGDQTGR
jgi:hypothetical protein